MPTAAAPRSVFRSPTGEPCGDRAARFALAALTFTCIVAGTVRAEDASRDLLLHTLANPPQPAELLRTDGDGVFLFRIHPAAAESGAAGRSPSPRVPPETPPAKEENPAANAPPQQQTVRAVELIEWGHPRPWRGDVALLLADGGILAGNANVLDSDVVRLQTRRVTIVTNLFDEVTLPQDKVRAVVLQPPADARGRDRLLAALAAHDEPDDLVLLTSGDRLTGSVRSIGDGQLKFARRGAVGQPDLDLTLAGPGGMGQVAAIALAREAPARAKDSPQKPCMRAGFEDGTLVDAEQLWRTDDEVKLLLDGGVTLHCDRPERLVAIQPLGQGITYLSDLAPHSFRHVPYLSQPLSYGTDRNVHGDRLRSGGRLYNKGLGLPSAARLTYQLEKPYRRFEAELALDDAAGGRGSVVCRVYLHIGGQWRAAWESKVIRGGDPPIPVSIDLADATAMTLLVDYADRADELDLANWLNPRLIE